MITRENRALTSSSVSVKFPALEATEYVSSAQRGVVAQICNLPYRRFVIGKTSESSSATARPTCRRMQFCDTADYKSALR